MASPPPNQDTRELPYGWTQQYNWEYRQWFYVNTREQPPRSSWEHPLGPVPQGYAAPMGPPPSDRSYSRSPYGGSGPPPPPPQGYGGYPGYQGSPPSGYYNNAPSGGYGGPPGYSGNRGGYSQAPERVVYVEEQQSKQRKGPGIGTALAAGGAGLLGGALLTEAFEHHNEYERDQGYDQGYDNGYDNGYDDGGGFF